MPDTKISDLTAETTLANNDEFVIVDTSAVQTERITYSSLKTLLAALYAEKATFPWEMTIALGDEDTAITATGTAITKFRMPYAVTLTDVRLSVNTATTTGVLTLDINESGTTVLSTKLTIDATEKTSETAATAAVISDSALADDAEISFDWDGIGDGTATGAKVTLYGTRVLA